MLIASYCRSQTTDAKVKHIQSSFFLLISNKQHFVFIIRSFFSVYILLCHLLSSQFNLYQYDQCVIFFSSLLFHIILIEFTNSCTDLCILTFYIDHQFYFERRKKKFFIGLIDYNILHKLIVC